MIMQSIHPDPHTEFKVDYHFDGAHPFVVVTIRMGLDSITLHINRSSLSKMGELHEVLTEALVELESEIYRLEHEAKAA